MVSQLHDDPAPALDPIDQNLDFLLEDISEEDAAERLRDSLARAGSSSWTKHELGLLFTQFAQSAHDKSIPEIERPPDVHIGRAKSPNVFLRDLRLSVPSRKKNLETTCGVALSPALHGLANALDKASWIASLDDDWDGEGSSGYDEDTVRRAQQFLAENAERMWREVGGLTPPPSITPGPDGSIDIQWRLPRRELLLNIPPAPEAYATFYGDNRSEASIIEGSQRIDEPATWMLMWLMNQ